MGRLGKPDTSPILATPIVSSNPSTPNTTRISTRIRRPSISLPTTQSLPTMPSQPTAGPSTQPFPPPSMIAPAFPSRFVATPSRQPIEAKAHGLRSVGSVDKAECPFPAQFGGCEKCGVSEEDERDESLMAICASIASTVCSRKPVASHIDPQNNRALSAEEIAEIAIDSGWMRPSRAIPAPTIVNNLIRDHLKRCEKAEPPREPLLSKHQLTGSVNESVLEDALHPSAFESGLRPKGTVWYLTTIGRTKWKNPFDGIELPKPPPKKTTTAKPKPKDAKPKKTDKDEKLAKGKDKSTPSVKIRLVFNNSKLREADAVSSYGETSRSVSESRSASVTPSVPSLVRPTSGRGRARRILDPLESSDSDSSDTDASKSPHVRTVAKPFATRRLTPLALNSAHSPRFGHVLQRVRAYSPHTPNSELFAPPAPNATSTQHSPFPSHSLDNTFWTPRANPSRNAYETSSSSSDDETREREGDWVHPPDVYIQGELGEDEDMPQSAWFLEQDGTVKEATDALRVLFPMTSPPTDKQEEPAVDLSKLDNRHAPSDTSSIADTSSSATARAMDRGQVKQLADASSALVISLITTSPVPSPQLKVFNLPRLIADSPSPTTHLSRLRNSMDMETMELDRLWLDDGGELPVKAEDTFSDVDAVSAIGDAETPESDRQLKTAAWALEAAAANTSITHLGVKQEPEDYPSPMTTEGSDRYRSRASSADHSHSPSTGSSESTDMDIDSAHAAKVHIHADIDQVNLGPESISIEELDGWMPSQKMKPQRGRKRRSDPTRISGNWGNIGVGLLSAIESISPPAPVPQTTKRTRAKTSRRSSTRSQVRAASVPLEAIRSSDLFELDPDCIGPDDLETARAEAEAREERIRAAHRERNERQSALLNAFKDAVTTDDSSLSTPAAFSDTTSWPVDTPSILSPMLLQGVSTLSLSDVMVSPPYSAVDPKALKSPPLLAEAPKQVEASQTTMLDEVMSQAEVEAVTSAVSPSPPLTDLPSDALRTSVTATQDVPILEKLLGQAKPIAANKPKLESQSSKSDVSEPKEEVKAATLATAVSKPPTSVVRRLCKGVDACVEDNIPVYKHVWQNSSGRGILLRRLDTDFGECFLHASVPG